MHSDNLAVQIAEKMKKLLPDKNNPAASFLSARQAAERFKCSRQTANNALNILAEEGLLIRKRGSGTTVCGRSKQPQLACLLVNDHSNFSSPANFYKNSYINKLLLGNLEKNHYSYQIFSYQDLQRANFSPHLFKPFDGLIINSAYSDPHSRQLVNDFAHPKLWLCPSRILSENGNQVLLDHMTPLCEIFQKAKASGIRKCYLHYLREDFLQIMQTAMLYSNYEQSAQVTIKHDSSSLHAYKKAQDLEFAPDILHACQADHTAWGLFEAFMDRGAQLGEFHVTGCGDTEGLGFYPLERPRLTSVNYQYDLSIEMGTGLLLKKIRERSLISEIICIPGKISFRESAFYDRDKQ